MKGEHASAHVCMGVNWYFGLLYVVFISSLVPLECLSLYIL